LAQKKVDVRLEEVEKWHSKDATYVVSAVNGELYKSYRPLPTLLNNVDKFHFDNGSEFAFHLTDRYAHIVIDLKKEVAVSRLFIQNRLGEVAPRAKGMTVHLSNSPTQRGQQIWQAPDGANEWNVLLDQVYVGRYLVLARDPNLESEKPFFHLRKVKVFGPE
jgi:hypothetical protein